MQIKPPEVSPPAEVKVCAVMVTYNPDSSLEQNIRALLPHVDRLIVVDNGSEPPIRADIEAISSACQVDVIWNNENLGLASALNIGIRQGLASGDYTWIATFDQDSRVSSGFRDAMLEAYLVLPISRQSGDHRAPSCAIRRRRVGRQLLRGGRNRCFVKQPLRYAIRHSFKRSASSKNRFL